jgi:hypothetical protein
VVAYEALVIVQRMQDMAAAEYGKTSGPYQALHAVRRKVLTLADAEQANRDRMRAESAKVEAMRDSGVLADGLAAAKARSEAQAEQDAANDPLVVLLNNTTPVASDGGLVILAGEPEPKSPAQVEWEIDDAFAELENLERRRDAVRAVARSNAAGIAPVGARVHAAVSDAQVDRVMATLAEQAVGTTVLFRAFGRHSGPGRVAGRLIPLSKSGQRRPKRSKRSRRG